jgi:hypothetical protein
MSLLLSVDWDFFSGSLEHIFDSPLWGTSDREPDRCDRWRERARARGGSNFEALGHDFPLIGDPRGLLRFSGSPTFAVQNHDAAHDLIKRLNISSVINFDSHHDLFSSSGDPNRVRPGNWAGLALERGLMGSYSCVYPSWHQDVRVSEGFDLERTWTEIGVRPWKKRAFLERSDSLLDSLEPDQVQAVLLVLSPSWTNPLFDPDFFDLARLLKADLEHGLRPREFNKS